MDDLQQRLKKLETENQGLKTEKTGLQRQLESLRYSYQAMMAGNSPADGYG